MTGWNQAPPRGHGGIPEAEHQRQSSFVWSLPKEDPEWLTKQEVAKLGRVSLDTVEKLVKDGILEPYQIGRSGHLRFKRVDVEANMFRRVEVEKPTTKRGSK